MYLKLTKKLIKVKQKSKKNQVISNIINVMCNNDSHKKLDTLIIT